MSNETLKNEHDENKPDREKPLIISRVTFDEKTGTLTLKIASEEEIAEAEKLKNEKLTMNN
jgi:hypothetical protein